MGNRPNSFYQQVTTAGNSNIHTPVIVVPHNYCPAVHPILYWFHKSNQFYSRNCRRVCPTDVEGLVLMDRNTSRTTEHLIVSSVKLSKGKHGQDIVVQQTDGTRIRKISTGWYIDGKHHHMTHEPIPTIIIRTRGLRTREQ